MKLTAAGTVPDSHRIPYYPLWPDGGKGTVAGTNVEQDFQIRLLNISAQRLALAGYGAGRAAPRIRADRRAKN